MAADGKATKPLAKTAAQRAFDASGLTYEQLARRASVSPGYAKRLLRRGCDCWVTADRLRRALGCPVEFFLPGQARSQIKKAQIAQAKSEIQKTPARQL